MAEQCAICGCPVHRVASTYAQASIAGRSHAFKHYYVAERFFGRTKNRHGGLIEGIFPFCPWKHEGQTGVLCYECHEELLANPVMLPQEVARFAELVKRRGLREEVKTDSRVPIAGRVELLHDVISLGLNAALKKELLRARRQTLRGLAPLLGGFAAIFLLVGFSPWAEAFSAPENTAMQGWIFVLAGLGACALLPDRPFLSAFLGAAGVLAGTLAGLVLHVIVSNAMGADPHQGFSAFSIASHAAMAAPCLLLSALLWKMGSASFFWDMGHLRAFAEARIHTQRGRLIDSLSVDIAALKSKLAASAGPGAGGAEQEVVHLCCNAMFALAESVLTQYDGIVAELLVPNALAVKQLIRSVPEQLQPLYDECLFQVRREANLVGSPDTTAKCVATLQTRFVSICDDVALTLTASLAERYRSLLGEITALLHRVFERFPKFVWSAHR